MKKAWMIALVCVLALLAGCGAEEVFDKIESGFDSVEDGFDSVEEKFDDLEKGLDALDGKLNGTEAAPTAEPEETPAAEQDAEAAPAETASDDTVRPEIKEAIDSYEAFFNEYADFMESYDSSDLSAMTEYLSMMQQYADTMEKMDDMEDDDLTSAELNYYTQATLRIEQRLLEVAG